MNHKKQSRQKKWHSTKNIATKTILNAVAGEPMALMEWTIVNKKDTIFKYIFWERLDYLPIPECCFHFIWCQVA